MDKNSKIYITGHSGLVGKNLHQRLLKDEFSNIITIGSENLDLRNQSDVDIFFKNEKPEYVFHLAAKVGGIKANIDNPSDFLYDNLMINANVIKSAYKYKVKKLINLGSSCMYPRNCKQPMKESFLLSGHLEPTNEGYALAKITGLKLCEYYRQKEADFSTLIAPNIYGPNEKNYTEGSHVIISLLHKFHDAKINKKDVTIWGSGEVRREFLYVKCLIDDLLFFMEHDFSCINIGVGEDISIKKLAEQIKLVTKFKGKIKFDKTKPEGMKQKLLDSSKADKFRRRLDIDLKYGLTETYKWFFKKNKDKLNIGKLFM